MSVRALVLLAALLVIPACGGESTRDVALAELRSAGWDESEAVCYVDGVIEELGADALSAEAEMSPEMLDGLYRVSTGCRLNDDDPLRIDGPIGFGELTERDLNNDVDAMTEEEIVAWAEQYGLDAGPLAADVASLRRDALDALTVTRGHSLAEARCIVDWLYEELGKQGLDLLSAPTPEVAAAETAAIEECVEE